MFMKAKIDQFTLEQQELSQFSRLVSHPARIAIIQLLASKKMCISGDISKEIPHLNRVTISQHLQELKDFGLIKGEVDGVKVCYCLDVKKFIEFQHLFNQFFNAALTELNCECC